jgi:hypothetical protein
MADTSITCVFTSGQRIDRYISVGSTFYNGSSFENFNSSDWTSYASALTETGATGIYLAAFPSLAAGVYLITLRQRASTNPAISDTPIGSQLLSWDGAQFIDALVLDNDISAISSDLLSGPITVTLINPVVENGYITIVRGDDYFSADGRALVWSTSNAATWPDLTAATIVFTANINPSNTNSGAASITASGVVTVASGADKSIYVQLASSATSTLAVGANAYNYDVRATLSDGHLVRLALGSMTVKQNQSTP